MHFRASRHDVAKVLQLFLHLLTPIPTPDLLPLTTISRRIYSLILRILQNRLLAASELRDHTLLLECYHPSAKLTEPPYFCAYHGTDGLSQYDGSGPRASCVGQLGEMHNMYSHFKPHRRHLETGGRRVLPRPGDILGSRTFPGTVQDTGDDETVKQTLSLDTGELFTQVVAQVNLVKIGPRNGLFTCFVGVEDDVMRVWREWLRNTAAKGPAPSHIITQQPVKLAGKGRSVAHGVDEIDIDDARILWVNEAKNTGLKFNVRERRHRSDVPILIRNDEDIPATYEIEYLGT